VSSRQRLEDRRLTRQARRAGGAAAAGAAAGAAGARDGDGAEDGGAAEDAGAGGGGPGAAGPGDGVVAGEIGAGSSPRRRGAALLDAVTAGALTAGERGLKAAAPLAGAVFGCVRDRTSRPRVSPRIVPRRHGRAPTADELAGLGDDKVGGRHARHVETVVAAGNGADPVRSARHPDIRAPSAITGRQVAADGRVLGVTASGLRVHLTTPGWARRDGQRLATPSGYRDQQPAARTS
jgi:hypothetical protein